MHAKISSYQLGHILAFLKKDYLLYGHKAEDRQAVFAQIDSAGELAIPAPKTIMPFKKILFENNRTPKKDNRKIAFLALPPCDAWALEIFLKQFKKVDLLPERKNLFVMTTECEPDEHCFCNAFGFKEPKFFDLHLEKSGSGFTVFTGSEKGESLLKMVGIKPSVKPSKPKEIPNKKAQISPEELAEEVGNKALHLDFWQKIANNCFACGACTAVCPLCFCTRQEFNNLPAGESKKSGCENCLSWDACFSKSFFEIQHHHDLEPKNVDHLYNWYHHKFVRAVSETGESLCTGCGRCIEACPANLNQEGIMRAVTKE